MKYFGRIFYSHSLDVINSSDDNLENIRYQILDTYKHGNKISTQGLLFSEPFIFESSGGLGQSRLIKYQLQKTDNAPFKYDVLKLPDNIFVEGITELDDTILMTTLKKEELLVIDKKSMRLREKYTFTGDGWGVLRDDDTIVISNSTTDMSRFRLGNKVPIKKHKVLANNVILKGINEMEMVGEYIFANIWPTDCIAIIDKTNFVVLAWLDLSRLYPVTNRKYWSSVANGIAYDKKTGVLYVTGKNWDKIFAIKFESLNEKNN